MAAHQDSVDLGPERVTPCRDLVAVLAAADAPDDSPRRLDPGRRSGRGDRRPARPPGPRPCRRPAVRSASRTGPGTCGSSTRRRRAMVGLDGGGAPPGVERVDGVATGRLVDADGWLADRLPAGRPPDLAAVGRRLAGLRGHRGDRRHPGGPPGGSRGPAAAVAGRARSPAGGRSPGAVALAGADRPGRARLGPGQGDGRRRLLSGGGGAGRPRGRRPPARPSGRRPLREPHRRRAGGGRLGGGRAPAG